MESYRGLGWRAPFLAVSLTVFLFSLIGVPPTAGFTGKFQLFMGVLNVAATPQGGTAYYLLAIAAAVNTAVSAYYYLRIVKAMYLERGGETGPLSFPALGHLVVLGMLVMTIYLFFRADVLLDSTLNLKMHV
jgi:NADH-quinone oxidoreductase subunit N